MQKNRNLAVNAALLSDYRIANIRVLSQQLFRSLDKEEYGFITYSHVNNMKSAVWGWRGEGTGKQGSEGRGRKGGGLRRASTAEGGGRGGDAEGRKPAV